jgi:protein-tyrosine phosphatase
MATFFLDDTDLSEIIKHRLYLSSGAGPYTKRERLKELKITHILSVTLFPPKNQHDDIIYKHINIDDLSHIKIIDYFPECYDFIESARKKKSAALVHCDAGISRSSTVVISYLIKRKKMSLKEAYLYVKKRRALISPNFGFIVQLTEWERQVFKLPRNNLSFLVFYLREYFGYEENTYTDQEIENALSNCCPYIVLISELFRFSI